MKKEAQELISDHIKSIASFPMGEQNVDYLMYERLLNESFYFFERIKPYLSDELVPDFLKITISPDLAEQLNIAGKALSEPSRHRLESL